ncbi:hypothetical protein AB4Y38_39195 [Paraburkholderia sp. EG285A]|uniref:Uncharacterized protein n=1 Tax=Paraburkholderia unamae TaxID=219649 RepID=A0ACC6RXB8_9BURK
MQHVEDWPPPFRQVRATPAHGAVFQHHQLPFEERVQFGAVHVELIRCVANQHQGCKFVWTER